MTVSKNSILLSNADAVSTCFEVIGANMQSAINHQPSTINISVPSGITLSLFLPTE